METKIKRVSDNRRRVGLKRKQATQSVAYFPEPTRKFLPKWPPLNLSTNNLGKQRKLDECNSQKIRCDYCLRRSLCRYYSNFMKSGVLQRLMFYENSEWTDFSQDVVDLVKKDLQTKKSAIEVELNGYYFLLDFLHMFRLDLKTGKQQPIAWIDESANCFFPEIYSDDEECYECCQHKFGKDHDLKFREPYEPLEIKLEIEIDINGMNQSNLQECSGESNAGFKQIQINEEAAGNPYVVEFKDGCNRKTDGEMDDAVEEYQQKEAHLVTRTRPISGMLDSHMVRNMFLMGIKPFGTVDIIDLYRCSNNSRQAHFELFQKQVQITKQFRGDANVRNTWLASSKVALSTTMMYGFGYWGTSSAKSTYGTGVYLSSANYPDTSANSSDVDENGIRHMIFCRVIMGNMELLSPGTTQFHPSSEDFDNGVDDLDNPLHYIVWNVNMKTHIFPEFIISFKVSSKAEGHLVGSESKNSVSRVTRACQGPHEQFQFKSSAVNLGSNSCCVSDSGKSQGKAPSLVSSTPGALKFPKSPWMPFPMLLDGIFNAVHPKNMELVNSYYELFRAKKIRKEDFVNNLRVIVGDELLMSVLTNQHSKIPSECHIKAE